MQSNPREPKAQAQTAPNTVSDSFFLMTSMRGDNLNKIASPLLKRGSQSQ